jgi:hypothetical protein
MTATTGTLFDDPPSQQPAHSPRSSWVPPPAAWPTPPDPAAYHGLLGEIVRALEPETEADPFAILTQLLVAFGTAVGRRANFQIEATPHHPHEFLLLVGSSASNLRSVIPASWAAGSRNAHTKPSPLSAAADNGDYLPQPIICSDRHFPCSGRGSSWLHFG